MFRHYLEYPVPFLTPPLNLNIMALSNGSANLLAESLQTAILQINATRVTASKLPLTGGQIRTALATSFASLLPTTELSTILIG